MSMDNPGSAASSSGGGMTGAQSNPNHNLNPLSNGPSTGTGSSIDDGSGGGMNSCLNNTGVSNNMSSTGNNHLNSSLDDVKPSNLGSSSNSSTPQHQVSMILMAKD